MKLIWVHQGCLHNLSPAYLAHPGSPSIFVFDEAELTRSGFTMKRIGFLYECLLELPVVLRRGDPVQQVPLFARQMHCSGIVTMASPDPYLQAQTLTMGAQAIPQKPFTTVKGPLDLTRFSRYWRRVESQLLEPS